jgi:alpha-1,3-rhamnosyl/mannosyltransferase
MASGIPVLAAENSAMSEVVADAGILVNADDTDAIHCGLEKLLLDNHFRAKARHDGLLRAATFTWQSCVDQTISVYKKVRV